MDSKVNNNQTDLEQALRSALRDALLPLTATAACIYLLFTIYNWFTLLPPLRNGAVAEAFATFIIFTLFALAIQKWPPAAKSAQLLFALGIAIVACNNTLRLIQLENPAEATNTMLLLIVIGYFSVSGHWFAGLILGTYLSWLGAMSTLPPAANDHQFHLAIVLSIFVATMMHVVRRQTLNRLTIISAISASHAQDLESTATELVRSDERFRLLAESTFEGIVIHDDGHILDVNSTFSAMFGYDPQALIGSHLLSLSHPDQRWKAERALETSDFAPFETIAVHADGTEIPIAVFTRKIPYGGKSVLITAVRDLSEQLAVREAHQRAETAEYESQRMLDEISRREATEQQLKSAKQQAEDASRLKDSILANMSHEIRTPMTAILGFSELLSKRLQGTGNERQAQMIMKSGRRLLDLLNNIIDLAKLKSNEMNIERSPHALAITVERVAALWGLTAEKKGLTLHTDVADTIYVNTDPRREEQVLTNLISNAIRHTSKGEIWIRAQTASDQG